MLDLGERNEPFHFLEVHSSTITKSHEVERTLHTDASPVTTCCPHFAVVDSRLVIAVRGWILMQIPFGRFGRRRGAPDLDEVLEGGPVDTVDAPERPSDEP